MDYDVHITRRQEWSDVTEPGIPESDWQAFVSTDEEMVIAGVTEHTNPKGQLFRITQPLLTEWRGLSSRQTVWFSYFEGNLSVKNPDEEALEKPQSVAMALYAFVQGDDGERYDSPASKSDSKLGGSACSELDLTMPADFKLIPGKRIERRILLVWEKKVLLDFQLAELYEVESKALNQAVKRNLERFPEDFMFQLAEAEAEEITRSQVVIASVGDSGRWSQSVTSKGENASTSPLSNEILRSQAVTSKSGRVSGGRRFRPYAFTEQGVARLASARRKPVRDAGEHRDHADLRAAPAVGVVARGSRQEARHRGTQIRRAVPCRLRRHPRADEAGGARSNQARNRISHKPSRVGRQAQVRAKAKVSP
jgi:hypothetical protein